MPRNQETRKGQLSITAVHSVTEMREKGKKIRK